MTTDLIQKLRRETGAKILDCKEALEVTGGDLNAAKEWLRKKGMMSASRKTERLAGEGAIAVATKDGFGIMLELNCETDFVARTHDFQDFAHRTLNLAIQHQIRDLEQVKETAYEDTTVSGKILELAGKVSENVVLRRLVSIEVSPGQVIAYVHSPYATSLGRMGVLVALQSSAPHLVLQEIGKKIAMHVAASNPSYIKREDIPEDVVQQERLILTEQVASSGKPEAIIEKMVEGRLQKFYAEIVLEEQDFICEPGQTVRSFLEAEAKKAGTSIEITEAARFKVGED